MGELVECSVVVSVVSAGEKDHYRRTTTLCTASHGRAVDASSSARKGLWAGHGARSDKNFHTHTSKEGKTYFLP